MVSEVIEVESYSGHKYPETPRAFTYKHQHYVISKIEKTWRQESLEDKQRKILFRVRTEDNSLWEIAFQELTYQWFLERRLRTLEK